MQISFIPQGNIGGVTVDATLEEEYEDELEITEHPVQAGADITDHSFKRPVELTMRCGWSNSTAGAAISTLISALSGITQSGIVGGGMSGADYVSGIYSQLLALQASRQPFSVVSTLRAYDNMLIRSLRVARDSRTSQALMVTAQLREVILVSTQTTTLPAQGNQANPSSTAENVNVGASSLMAGNPAPGGAIDPSNWGIV